MLFFVVSALFFILIRKWIPQEDRNTYDIYLNYASQVVPVALAIEPGPQAFTSMEIFPNPVRTSTTIRFTLDQPERISLDIYTVSGQKVSTLVDELKPKGTHQVQWDVRDHSSGTYFVKTRVGQRVSTRKMIVVK